MSVPTPRSVFVRALNRILTRSQDIRIRHARSAYPIAMILTASCVQADGNRPSDSYVVHDSAGIRIVESNAPSWTDGTAWRIDAEPRLRIGAVDGEEGYLLDTVSGLARLSDGTIVAANMGSGTLHFYDSDGVHLRTVGRRGEGPGEFGQIFGLDVFHGDTIVVTDGGNLSSYLTAEGEFVRSARPEPVRHAGTIVRTGMPLADGGFIGYGWPQGDRAITGYWVDSAAFFRFDRAGGSPRHLRMLPVVAFVGRGGPRGQHIELDPNLSLAVGPEHFCHNFATSYDIECYDYDGELITILRRAYTPELVTPEIIAVFREQFINRGGEGGGLSAEQRAARERRFSEMIFADTLPAHTSMRFDRTGHLWVQYFDQPDYTTGGYNGFGAVPIQPARFSVFDPQGVWLGDIETPGRFRIFDIGADYILGITRDDMGVEYILMYGLEREG